MNRTTAPSSGHLEDGVLTGYMDHGLDLAGRRRAEGHLHHCPECRARLERLAADAERVGGWLGALDDSPPEAHREAARGAMEAARFRGRRAGFEGRGALAAAAVAVLALTLSFGTAPGRAWIGDAAARLGIGAPPQPIAQDASGAAEAAAAAAGEPVPLAEAELPPGTRAARGTRSGAPAPGTSHPVTFEPAGNYVLIRFQSRQQAGTAAIWIREGADPTGQIVSGRRAETLVPAADGLVVRNQPTSGADYTFVVPTRYRVLRVRIADEPETRIAIARSEQDGLWTLDLSGATRQPE